LLGNQQDVRPQHSLNKHDSLASLLVANDIVFVSELHGSIEDFQHLHRKFKRTFFCVCFSLISMFWPFPGFLVPTMTSVSKNLYRQPRFRFEFSYHNLMPFIDGQWLFSWTKDTSCPLEFQVRGSNQDIYGQPMVSSVPYVSMPDI
jgi:hypothetical protein